MPSTTAVIVVDMQNDTVHRDGAFGDSGAADHADAQEVVSHVRSVVDAARATGSQIFHNRIVVYPGAVGGTNAPVFRMLAEGSFVLGTWGAEIVDELAPQPGDVVLDRDRMSVFNGTAIDTMLRNAGVTHVIVVGAWTNMAVEHTARRRRSRLRRDDRLRRDLEPQPRVAGRRARLRAHQHRDHRDDRRDAEPALMSATPRSDHASIMRAAWYDRRGPAADVLQVGELPLPTPGPGEVRVRIRRSGINPGDTKKRSGFFDTTMPYPRVIPHSDGAGTIDAVGVGVDAARIGSRAWVYGAQSYRAFGTAAEAVVVPERLAVDLPDAVSDDLGATLGIAGITAHRAVVGDGPVAGTTVLVQGILGGVGSMAARLALWAGSAVIGTVRSERDLELASHRFDVPLVALDSSDPVGAIRRVAPAGVDRVVEVSFSDNVDLDAAVVRNGGVVAAYATRDERPSMPFWPMLFDNVTVRLLGSDDFPDDARVAAVADLTRAAADGALTVSTVVLPLDEIAKAHDLVDRGPRERVLVQLD